MCVCVCEKGIGVGGKRARRKEMDEHEAKKENMICSEGERERGGRRRRYMLAASDVRYRCRTLEREEFVCLISCVFVCDPSGIKKTDPFYLRSSSQSRRGRVRRDPEGRKIGNFEVFHSKFSTWTSERGS